MKLPFLQEGATYREMTDTFAGYNHNLKIGAGEFYFTKNLTTQYFPLMATRKKRGFVKHLFSPGGLIDKVDLAYVDEGTLYIGDRPTPLSGMTPGEKQLVNMGAYICIFPDRMYYNTAQPDDYGPMWTRFEADVTKWSICGGPNNGMDAWHYLEKPEDTSDSCYFFLFPQGEDMDAIVADMGRFVRGDIIRLDSEKTDYSKVYGYAEIQANWLKRNPCTILAVYTDQVDISDPDKIPIEMQNVKPDGTGGTKTENWSVTSPYHPVTFDGGAGLTIYSTPFSSAPERILAVYVNGTRMTTGWAYNYTTGIVKFDTAPGEGKGNIKIVYQTKGTGLTGPAFLLSVPKKTDGADYQGSLASDNIPEMDFVIECNNRLWGCKYGVVNGENLNEIYACELGNFRNWRRFEGGSMDPWTASVGSDGPWTGAVNYMGYPTFFKEDRIHRVSVSSVGAHSIQETVCDGVQAGSGKSLAVINGYLIYKSNTHVCIYQGGFPATISEALGDEHYTDAVGAANGYSYYVSMKDSQGEWQLFCYDTKKNLWMREDDLHVVQFATVGEELYALTEDNALWALNGTSGEEEANILWTSETGILYYQQPDKKYVSRFNFRMQMEDGARCRVFIDYDSSGIWTPVGEIISRGTRTITLPVKPKRCDHMRIRMEGIGEMKIFSIAKILEIGSDY